MNRFKWLLVPVALLALLLVGAGCATSGDDKKSGKPAASEKDAAGKMEEHAGSTGDADHEMMAHPTIRIIAPANGSTVLGPNVSFVIDVDNFKLSNKMSQANVPGEGHVGWVLDGGAANQNAATTLPLEGLSKGEHTMKVDLHQNLHEPLDPPVEDTITFTVK